MQLVALTRVWGVDAVGAHSCMRGECRLMSVWWMQSVALIGSAKSADAASFAISYMRNKCLGLVLVQWV